MENNDDIILRMSKEDHNFLIAVLNDSHKEWSGIADDMENPFMAILPRQMSIDINKLIDKVENHHKRKTECPHEKDKDEIT